MKRKIDPQIIKWLIETLKELPLLTENEALSLVPMFRSTDVEIRDAAAEILYYTNWKDMKNTIEAFKECCWWPDVYRLCEITDCHKYMDCIENDYDNKLAKIIYDENSRLRQADQIVQALL